MSTRAEPANTAAKDSANTAATLITPTLLRSWPLPSAGSDKYSRGAVLVVGGGRRTPGAALLAGTAALRAGAGRVTLAVAESVAVQLAVSLPEAGVIGLPQSAGGSVGDAGLENLLGDFDAADAVLIGPGLDDIGQTEALLRGLLRHDSAKDPDQNAGPTVVLDAYALGALPQLAEELGPWAGRLILTPNPAEAAILLGRDTGDLAADVVELAGKYRAVVSCQGMIAGPPAVGSPDGGSPDGSSSADDFPVTGDHWEITTGYGGLGTSGSGDILAGAIAGLRARGTSDAQAACWGTHLHAAAGDRLASRVGSLGYLARELADELPPLMMELGT
ncbi:ADP-dependent NAD(P)H-hydrate dehydratase [Arthrobacter globiformis]|uniref:ADP-dependent NAD(P)H-hydrate dehydratase n=1 Tax=Arthrobacter globiformis TaxID=1665 RepID=UPI00278A5CBF|nr:ADP/ATP-dependent (S)-NAD(P)H-hydrate dehydratase [Arthrobacter globiformis]MDQ0866612.1 ADP-dependent NAD(P)H-hydrate dehydratase [Arthrobacter globiformis]